MHVYAWAPKFSSRRLVSLGLRSGPRNLPQSTGSEALVNSNIAGLCFLGAPRSDDVLNYSLFPTLY